MFLNKKIYLLIISILIFVVLLLVVVPILVGSNYCRRDHEQSKKYLGRDLDYYTPATQECIHDNLFNIGLREIFGGKY